MTVLDNIRYHITVGNALQMLFLQRSEHWSETDILSGLHTVQRGATLG